jgi:hypothetical protein
MRKDRSRQVLAPAEFGYIGSVSDQFGCRIVARLLVGSSCRS